MEVRSPLTIVIKQGDITKEQDVGAIVNAANSSFLGGGGVDGAIHQAAGPKLLEECKKIRERLLPKGCPTGSAVATGAGKLKAQYVFHAVGPDMRTGISNGAVLLKKTYESCFKLAQEKKINSIAFPSISTGIYFYPIKEAAEVALNALEDFFKNSQSDLKEVRFILFSKEDFECYANTFSKLILTEPPIFNFTLKFIKSTL